MVVNARLLQIHKYYHLRILKSEVCLSNGLCVTGSQRRVDIFLHLLNSVLNKDYWAYIWYIDHRRDISLSLPPPPNNKRIHYLSD